VGLKTYDFLAGKLSFGSSNFIHKKETLQRIESIKTSQLKGGITYHDGQFDDARLAINLAQSAVEHGATVLNYFEVIDLLKDSNNIINGVSAKNVETNKIYHLKSKVVINATGVFADDILKKDHPGASNSIRSSQGVHLILDKSFLPGNDAIMIPKTDDGRVLFIVPWENKLVVGTTDTLLDEHKLEPVALEEEIEFILSTANRYLTKTVTRKDVLSIFAGLRPLAAPKEGSEKTKEISRSHKIIVTKSKLITIIGGKWTTYRRMAQDTVNKANVVGSLPHIKCQTKKLALHGYSTAHDRFHPLNLYGSDKEAILEIAKSNTAFAKKIHPNYEFIFAEVVWAIRFEMARTLEDILARRVRLLFLDARAAKEAAPKVASLLTSELGKDAAWEKDQIDSFIQLAEQYHL
ncbi:MAG: glycerol-3-phosphate dehydrogenase/oxidase, partial [Bacteroidales bacterium]|nr:glycerol-3-phosphate dehydrogenase/oxidase [Bacteroidales bacterium]